LARWAMIPVENGEDMQVLRYELGQKYDAHHDVGELDSKSGQQLAADGGFRAATALLYLSDVEEGGETGNCVGVRWSLSGDTLVSLSRFTEGVCSAPRNTGSREHTGGWAGLANRSVPVLGVARRYQGHGDHLLRVRQHGRGRQTQEVRTAARPQSVPSLVSRQLTSARACRRCRGDVLLFWSVTLEGKIDPASMHAGCPVIRGTKWTGTKWLHQRPFRWTAPPKPGIPEGCEDQHINCPVRIPVWEPLESARRGRPPFREASVFRSDE